MSNYLAGILNLEDSERVYVNTVGQRVVYDAVNQILAEWNSNLVAMVNMFLEGTTDLVEEKFKNLQGGRMQRQGTLGVAGAGRTQGSWKVAYPLYQFGDAIGYDEVSSGYLTVAEVDRHLAALLGRSIHTMRWELLHRLLDNVNDTITDRYTDDKSLIIRALANTDGTIFPPLAAQEDGAEDEHYLASGYVTGSISDTNNPVKTLVAEVAEHFGEPEDIQMITFINGDERDSIEALADFTEANDRFIQAGNDTATLLGVPAGTNIPGMIIGRTNHSWISKWDYMPSGYLMSMMMSGMKPLKMRVDPSDTGLPQGLQLISASPENFPFYDAQYRHRFGLGVFNRVGAAVMELTAGSYSVPAAYD